MDRADWDHRYDSATLVWGAGPNALVAELLTPLAPGRALDLASGEGRHTLWLAGRGWRATGLEQSGVAVRRARELAAAHQPPLTGRATFEEADLVDWRPGPGTADLVLIAFLHLPAHERLEYAASADNERYRLAATAPAKLRVVHEEHRVSQIVYLNGYATLHKSLVMGLSLKKLQMKHYNVYM